MAKTCYPVNKKKYPVIRASQLFPYKDMIAQLLKDDAVFVEGKDIRRQSARYAAEKMSRLLGGKHVVAVRSVLKNEESGEILVGYSFAVLNQEFRKRKENVS